MKRKVIDNGFLQTTNDTYDASEHLSYDRHDKAHELIKDKRVEMDKLNMLINMSKGVGVNVLKFDFYEIVNVDAIFFKKKNESLDKLIRNYYEVDTDELQFQSIEEQIDMLNEIRFVCGDSVHYDVLADEANFLELVLDFMSDSDRLSGKILSIVGNHRRAIDIELNRAKKSMIAEDYFVLSNKRSKQMKELLDRIELNFKLLMSVSEN